MNLISINIYMYKWCIKLFFYSHHMPKYVFLTLKVFFKSSSVTVPVTLSMFLHCSDFEGDHTRHS